jgi:hypothetical protein
MTPTGPVEARCGSEQREGRTTVVHIHLGRDKSGVSPQNVYDVLMSDALARDDAKERDRNSSQREDLKRALPPGKIERERKTGFKPATNTLARWRFSSQ